MEGVDMERVARLEMVQQIPVSRLETIEGDGVSSTFDVNNIVLLCMLEHIVVSVIWLL